MTESNVYNPLDLNCKSPFGAVPSGTQVRFTVHPSRTDGVLRARLVARFEQRGGETVERAMPWRGLFGACDSFSCTLETDGYVGLVWYHFALEGTGARTELPVYQLTVYDGSEQVPDWYGQGVTYQIFPDRFRKGGMQPPARMSGARALHTGWTEEPVYRPDEQGEIRNRDFFGGNLPGVREKLPYLKELGVETLYLCPIFEAAENHRYGTGDYETVDPLLGRNEDFAALCRDAHALGMRVMLDGVFNHTGYISRYFNAADAYPEPGAYQSRRSRYADWFYFQHWPDKYSSWWGIYTLPTTNKENPDYQRYIYAGEQSIIRRWLRAGADGWRLDVADELPDAFLAGIHAAARAEKPDATIIGEVWEDGSHKIAYDVRRAHIWGRHCDGLLGYPFRSALLDFILGGDAADFMHSMETLREHYPPFAWQNAMNILGTHDTVRILTLLGAESAHLEQSRDWRAQYRLGTEEYARGMRRLRLAACILFAFPGSPTIYYGDEAGLEGFEDPFNRRTFPWGREDTALLDWYKKLGQARASLAPLRRGDIQYVCARGRLLAFSRTLGEQTVLCAVNAGKTAAPVPLPGSETDTLSLPPMAGRGLCTPAGGGTREGG